METTLLYSCVVWVLTAALRKSLDGCPTRMLWVVFNICWQQHITNKELYRDLPKVSNKVATRRLKLAFHYLRHPELPAEPTHGRKNEGQPAKTMVDTLKVDTGMANSGELRTLMLDCDD